MDKKKRTPLILCVGQGHQQMMELLIGAGKSIHAADRLYLEHETKLIDRKKYNNINDRK